MNYRIVCSLAVLCFYINASAQAASFDCQKAKSINEQLICSDAELSKIDEELAITYKEALKRTTNPKDLAANQRDEWRRREKECASKDCLINWFAQRKASLEKVSSQPKDLIAELQKKYSQDITFSSPRAAQIVNSYNIDCKSNDGRYLPLINLLYTSLAASGGKWKTKLFVENRGEEVRIYESGYFLDGRKMEGGGVKFEINRWGELIPHLGITTEAILNACYGSYGRIWVTPQINSNGR